MSHRGRRQAIFALANVEAKKRIQEHKEKQAEKSESAARERKSAYSRFFLLMPHSTGNPDPEPIVTWQAEKQAS
jgi:hypothetical protein